MVSTAPDARLTVVVAPGLWSTAWPPIAVTDSVSLRSTSLSLDSRLVPDVAPASSETVRASSPATGPSLTPVIVTVTVAVSVPPLPSLTV